MPASRAWSLPWPLFVAIVFGLAVTVGPAALMHCWMIDTARAFRQAWRLGAV